MLKKWYECLISPLSPYLVGIKSITFSVEDQLNYLPFEAFMHPSGKYLLQDYDINYTPSATVWLALQNRISNNSPEATLLAMGGATYQAPGTKTYDKTVIKEVNRSVLRKLNSNKRNYSDELKALGFGGANYLPGTLTEVQNLKTIVPTATVLTGNQMKESDIKRINSTGELANYKWVHIATHGFAIEYLPDLSGIMMTQPNTGDGKEDTYLLTNEIANLKLNADLVVLSACETALGKVYKGEGVTGLNTALLAAGTKHTLLSLWPVSDQGTMILMTHLYQKLYNEKLPVDIAINQVKREMANGNYGAQYKNPNFWAPFILCGK